MTCHTRRPSLMTMLTQALALGVALGVVSVACVQDARAAEGGVAFKLIGPDDQPVPMNITFQNVATGEERTFAAGAGHGIAPLLPSGKYKVYIRALWQGVGYVVDIKDVDVPENDVVNVQSAFVEGRGRMGLPAYDSDFDGVIDRVEHEAGTDPMNSTDIPGSPQVKFDPGVLKKEEGWYKGELRCYSTYSKSRLTIKNLIREAENKKLDFLAITGRRTLETCKDADFKSSSVLLIPAYEWGETGRATILGAKTLIKNWDNNAQVQAAIQLAHAQGVIFCIVDPCSPENPWNWTVTGFHHAMEVWNKEWRSEPGTKVESFAQLPMSEHLRKLGLALDNISKNGQALRLWDAILTDGYRVTAVGGSGAFDRLADIGSPITYVYARELSVQGIMEGIVSGHTFVSSGVNGPQLLFMADVNKDNEFEGVQGSVVPIPVSKEAEQLVQPIKFRVVVNGLKERGTMKLDVTRNGAIFKTEVVDPQKSTYEFEDAPTGPSYYRAELFRIVDDDKAAKGYGNVEMLALTSPIYTDWLPLPPQTQPQQQEQGKKPEGPKKQ